MVALIPLLCLAATLAHNVASSPVQVPMTATIQGPPRKLHGRFLQISDMHPDPHYKVHASQSSACHRNKPKKDEERAKLYGSPYSECDSPLLLTNFTLDFLDQNWTPEIDFVVWTGDNARHDNDRKLPRTTSEIYELNRAVAKKMEAVFTSKGIPVVPSLGNNDVWPHNILTPGPNSVTFEYSHIWKAFIPFRFNQVFQRGAYYTSEVIPNQVAVIALNTMYFYDSNKAVDGCDFLVPNDPGNLQFDWLEVQLKLYRERNMQVWISGHVPPSPGNYFPECFVRYVELSLRFQDTILGHLFGHMNADHFFFLEAEDLHVRRDPEPRLTVSDREMLFDVLIQDFQALPKSFKHTEFDNYSVINVSPPVVPNPYLPTFRIFSYNITGAEEAQLTIPSGKKKKGTKRRHGHRRGGGHEKHLCKEPPYRDTWKCQLDEPWNSDPESPSRTNTLWSPLGYAQFYLPNLDKANKKHEPEYKLEYLTFPPSMLHPPSDNQTETRYPIPLHHLPHSLQNVSITKSKYAPYQMDDLTIPSWIKLARRMVKPEHDKLREKFKRYMYLGSDLDE